MPSRNSQDYTPYFDYLVLDSGEQINIYDIYTFVFKAIEGDLPVIECLYTDYFIVNPIFQNSWNEIRELRNSILKSNLGGVLKSLQERASINIQYFVRQVGEKNQKTKEKYYVKPVIHMLRLENILNCLLNNNIDYLFKYTNDKTIISRLREGAYTFSEAQNILMSSYKKIMIESTKFGYFYSTQPKQELIQKANCLIEKTILVS